jgi:hypothetical protein
MHLIYCMRDDLLSALPPGGAAAEIGVATGGFSEVILKRAQPRLLHLVDPWEFQDRADYLEDRNNVPQEVADKRYNDVKARFARQIEGGQVALHRAYSVEAAQGVADGSLDWIFIDAMHTREAVLEDLAAWSPKVKKDGFILGHDYANHTRAREAGFGVVEAVQEFCQSQGYYFAFLTAEPFPSYLIVKDAASENWARLKYTVIKHLPCVMELTDPFALKYQQREYDTGDTGTKIVFSYSPLPTELPATPDSLGEVRLLMERPGTLVDVAAGRHAVTLASLNAPRIVGFEPSAAAFGTLIGQLPSATLYHAAAGAEFHAGRGLTLTIDQLGLNDLSFLSLAADGREKAVLKGAAETIARCKPVIRLEAPQDRADGLLEDPNYRGFVLTKNGMTELAHHTGSDASSILFVRQDDLWGLQRLALLAAERFQGA